VRLGGCWARIRVCYVWRYRHWNRCDSLVQPLSLLTIKRLLELDSAHIIDKLVAVVDVNPVRAKTRAFRVDCATWEFNNRLRPTTSSNLEVHSTYNNNRHRQRSRVQGDSVVSSFLLWLDCRTTPTEATSERAETDKRFTRE
jgi:hypothetical protein